MTECPRCGGSAQPDPEHSGVLRCLSCWDVWTLPTEWRCPGAGRGSPAPFLRLLKRALGGDYADLVLPLHDLADRILTEDR